MALRAVAFDLDGTLYSFRHLALRAVVFAARNLRFAPVFSRVRAEIRKVRPIEDFHRCQTALFAKASGLSVEKAAEWIERRIYGEWVHSFRSIVPYPGLRSFLDRIAERGLKAAVLSDFPVAEKLKYLGLEECFEVAMCAEESGYLKPNPEPFLLLSERLGVAPAELLFVGDSYEYDIVGARELGLKTALISSRRSPGKVDVRFTRYEALLAALDTL